MAKLIFGCGYLGMRVAQLWRSAGAKVFAVTRSVERAKRLAGEGLEPLIGNLVTDTQLPVPQEVRTVFFGVGYDRSAGHLIHDVFVGGLASAIQWLPPTVERFIYISSTGVYGQVTGEEVDEDSPCEPTSEGGKACLAAEELLRRSRLANQAIILRLAGIYGRGRMRRAADLAAGNAIDASANGWMNLIHVDDAARIVVLAETLAIPPRTYVVSDGHPVERGAYYAELARLLGAPPPRFKDSSADSPSAGRAASNKRVNPRRLFAELSPALLYPSVREGLADIIAGREGREHAPRTVGRDGMWP